jgi:CRP-like cAMP-binding protein
MTPLLQQNALRNQLLQSLSVEEFSLLQPHLERGSYEQGAVMEAPGETITHVYFPEPGMVSVVAKTPGGVRLEAGIIGPEGMTGLAVINGTDRSPHEAFVQIPCRAVRLEVAAFNLAIRTSRPLHDRFLLYAQTFSVQLANTVLCNGQFTIDQRLARWLLMSHDRADREDLPLTHEFLSLMLGVRRAGVTTALASLEQTGAIKARRGGLSIRDRRILVERAGDGYGSTETEYARIMTLS